MYAAQAAALSGGGEEEEERVKLRHCASLLSPSSPPGWPCVRSTGSSSRGRGWQGVGGR